ncbi:restriction endonuclease subunit S [uncultured Fusobacterium sp.]|uniref:restriction endonuclease subunit S n=1 Tax=uncultured Fusobacterium sp. TaxID=159267 RepID=UPI0025E301D2|nr:restriction endonuclease subunit S [uncultured Fusobacterium sp.]
MRKVPKLRFKEFSDEWEEKKLGDILEFKNGVNASKEQYGKGIKFINVLDILNNDFITYDNIIGKVDIDNNTVEKYSVTYGDILFQRSSETREEVGMANVYLDKKNIATFGGFVIRGKKIGEYIPIFLNKLLKTNLARNEITSKSGGSTRYNVGQETLKDVRLLFPILQEQEKIANFLTNIDKKISLTEKKLELFREYKKGVMQKIFSQELRFKDSNGNDYPEWEEKTLGNYINFLTGYPFNSKKFNEEKRGVPLIRIRNLLDSNISTYYEGEYENKYIIKREDILIGMDGDFNVVKWKNNGALLNQRIVKVFSKNNLELCNTFLYYILEKPIKNINLKTFSTTVKHLSVKDIEKIIVNLPILKEQEKIANFLSDIDNKIENIEKELEGLKEFKKGLLQQMFV